MNSQPFLNDDSLIKSHQDLKVQEPLIKAIPTMPAFKGGQPVDPAGREVPSAVKKFKSKVESIFKELDIIVGDIKDTPNWENCEYFMENYNRFKKEFQNKVNNIIQYPMDEKQIAAKKKSDEGKVNIA